MIHKLFILATVYLAAVSAHPGNHIERAAASAGTPITTSTFKFSETFPEAGIIPTAKPEWLELIKGVNITAAPVYKPAAGLGPQPEVAGQDPYCDWTFTGCFGKDDLYECPKGQWALTYDDGPSEFSPALYDYLDEQNVKVTFFMVGGQVVKFPDYTLRAYKSGHELAMHTWSHNYMTTLTNEQIVAELKWNELAIKEVTGVAPKYFRPPYGDIDNRVRDVASALGFIPVIWNYDTNDWAHASSPKTYSESWVTGNVTKWVKGASTAAVGGVSLEHDLYKATVDIAIKILPGLKSAYTLTPVGTCNNVNMYKDGNATVAASTSIIPSISAALEPTLTPVSSSSTNPSESATLVAKVVSQSSSGTTSLTGAGALGLGVTVVVAAALL